MRISYDTDDIVQEKIQAIKQVYHDWGVILRAALRNIAPYDTGTLYRAIRFRVDSPRSRRDITGTVRLLVGILDPNSPALQYLRYIVEGNRYPHFVPVTTNDGINTGILEWAQRHGLVHLSRGKKGRGRLVWRWREGDNAYRRFEGVRTFHRGNDMFNRVYERYYNQIQSEIQDILRSE